MNNAEFFLALCFLLATAIIDSLYGHTMMGKVACLFLISLTLGFALLALPSDKEK